MRLLTTYNWFTALLLLALTVFSSCSEDEDTPTPTGTLRVRLEGIATTVVTRSAPSELEKPDTTEFRVGITNSDGELVYDRPYTDSDINLQAGTYTVEASYGTNPLLGLDVPYYLGSTSVTVVDDKATQANITCKVANSLVSARFGRTDAEKARFDKFYESYSLQVHIGDKYATIPGSAPSKSVYFRAGSSVDLVFAGKLKADGRKVSTQLDISESTFPSVFKAAEHAIVTLSLPDPENIAVIDISKVEVEEATIEGTIPLSWLPLPQVKPAHNYDSNGNLRGTDITFTDSYPGMNWKVEVTGASDAATYRSMEGSGELVSKYSDNADGWVYVPAGEYNATFYIMNGGEYAKTGSRSFTVSNPSLTVSASAYTSYSQYLAGNVDAANACNAYTVYSPVVSVNIASSLWNNSKYSKSANITLGGAALSDATVTGDNSGMVFTYQNQSGKTPQLGSYALVGNITFGNTSVSGQHDVYITGLPASWAPPTSGDWSSSGTVSWSDSDNNKSCVRLGKNTTGSQYITCSKFAVPAGVNVEISYDVMTEGATVGTTLTLSFGSNNYFSKESGSRNEFKRKTTYYTDKAQFITGSAVTEAKAHNSYGAAQTCSRVYSLSFKYRK